MRVFLTSEQKLVRKIVKNKNIVRKIFNAGEESAITMKSNASLTAL